MTIGAIVSPLITIGGLCAAVWMMLSGIESGAVLAIPAILTGGAKLVAAFRSGD